MFQLLHCINNKEVVSEELEHTYYEAKHNRMLKFNKKSNGYVLSEYGEFVLKKLSEKYKL